MRCPSFWVFSKRQCRAQVASAGKPIKVFCPVEAKDTKLELWINKNPARGPVDDVRRKIWHESVIFCNLSVILYCKKHWWMVSIKQCLRYLHLRFQYSHCISTSIHIQCSGLIFACLFYLGNRLFHQPSPFSKREVMSIPR